MKKEFSIREFSNVDSSEFFSKYFRSLLLQSMLPYSVAFKSFAADHFRLRSDASIVDIGCGCGSACAYFSAHLGDGGRIVGVDRCQKFLDYCDAYIAPNFPQAFFVRGDVRKLTFADNEFDCCFIDRVLHHVDDIAAALQEIRRILKPGGKLVVMEPDFASAILSPKYKDVSTIWQEYFAKDVTHAKMGRELMSIMMDNGFGDLYSKAETVDVNNLNFCCSFGVSFYAYLERAVADGRLSQVVVDEYLQRVDGVDGRRKEMHFMMDLFMVAGVNNK
ncbi:MAG: methyltransferase domain-containing protein [Gammaproteobacteria bacterium]|nr:methyltransferase domain-containing protein [Gammaproteobacteria bacterium]